MRKVLITCLFLTLTSFLLPGKTSGVFPYGLTQTLGRSSDENMVFSPISVYFAMALMAEGADDCVADSIAMTMGEPSTDAYLAKCKQISAHFDEIESGSEDSEECPLTIAKIANSLWFDSSFKPFRSYVDSCRTKLDAQIATADFNSPLAAEEINRWCNKETNGLIPKIISPGATSGALMIAANALYLKSQWDKTFIKTNNPIKFTNLNGSEAFAPAMVSTQSTSYARGSDGEMINLKLGFNRELTFSIFLPASLDIAPIELLNQNRIDSLRQNLHEKEIMLIMPRFTTTSDFPDLAQRLQEVGLTAPYQLSDTTFTKISKQPIFINAIIQKAKIEVDVKGIEAAATTIVTMFGATGFEPARSEPYKLTVDRPFAWQITDNATGAVLLVGTVNNL